VRSEKYEGRRKKEEGRRMRNEGGGEFFRSVVDSGGGSGQEAA
jgi:hypothetical protein